MSPQHPSASLSAVFRRPFDEQVAFFRGKLGNLVPTERWTDIWKQSHDRAFMVAGAAKAELLADLAAAVDAAIAEGESIESFRGRFGDIVQRHGWQGWTGSDSEAGRAWRTRVIYTTNAATSYAAGRLAQLKQGGFAYWVYRHSDSVLHPRPLHLAWDGLTLPADHEWWRTHYPPNGWGCRCFIVGARDAAGARRLGGDPDKPLDPAWDEIDPGTREPVGIDKGWGYMPGRKAEAIKAIARAFSRFDPGMADLAATFAGKTIAWPYELAKAFMGGVPAEVRDALALAVRAQPETGEAVRRYAQAAVEGRPVDTYRTMGLLTRDEAVRIADMTGVEALKREMYDWVVDRTAPLHIRDHHGNPATEAERGQIAIVAADYAVLPRLILETESMQYAGMSGLGRPLVQVEATIGEHRYTAVFEIRKGRRMAALISMWKRAAAPRQRP